jgi:phosphopantetheinyl transferase
MRQRSHKKANVKSQGWFLQIDIHNYFNTIHRPTLYAMLCQRLAQMQNRRVLSASHAWLYAVCATKYWLQNGLFHGVKVLF